MIEYETYCIIKRMNEEGLKPSQIATRLGLSAKTVKKYLLQDRFRQQVRPGRVGKLDLYRERIKQLLERYNYSSAQVLRIIREEGYTGGSSILRDYVAKVRPATSKAFFILKFAPGEAAQVDFAYCGTISVENVRRRLYVFAMTCCHSRMMFVKFIMRQNMEHFLQCHREAFEYFGAVPRKVMVDNCKVAVLDNPRHADPVFNPRYGDLAAHYGFRMEACAPRCPHEKGRVERAIGYIKGNFLNGMETGTLEALNHDAREWMEQTANVRMHSVTKRRPVDMFPDDHNAMSPLPLMPYNCAVSAPKTANSQCRVVFESNRYSVPAKIAGKKVEMAVLPDKIILRYENQEVAEHRRSYGNNLDIVDPEHEKSLLEHRRLAGNSRIIKSFLSMGEVAEQYYHGLRKRRLNHDSHVRKIMALVDRYGKDEIIKAMADGMHFDAFSAEYINNIVDIRSRKLPEPGPLMLTRKSECLEIELDEPDLSIYDI